jgi:hypothetical protein
MAEAGTFDMRVAARRPVRLAASIRSGGGDMIEVEMSDISESGCQIRKTSLLEEGTELLLTIPSFTSFAAVIVWAEEMSMGVRFDKRLHPMILERVLSLSEATA